MDLPQEWVYPILFNLACELAYSYGKFVELQQMQPKALMLKQALNEFDTDDEDTCIYLDPSKYPGNYNTPY
jgi:hypothetical protein